MPTAKRAKYLEKQARKKINQRTKEDRIEKTNEIKDNLKKAHLTPEILPQIEDFYKVIDKFVEDGIPIQGIIPLPDVKAKIIYFFTNNKTKGLDAMVKYDNNNGNIKKSIDNNKKMTKSELIEQIKNS